MSPRPQAGFSLAEVLFSLVLLLIGVLTLLALLPTALREVQKSRFQVYAAAKAVDLLESFTSTHPVYQFGVTSGNNFWSTMQLEANQPWDHSAGYKAFSPDFEAFSAGSRSGFYPLPETIAYRLDSDRDEIRAILDAGGQLYYANPAANNGVKQEWTFDVNPPRDAQRLVFAVRGAAQQNALMFFPWKAWPYYAPYPSPPMGSGPFGTNLAANNWGDMTTTGYRSILQLWEREDPHNLNLNVLANVGLDADGRVRRDIFGRWDSAGYGGTSMYRDACEARALGYLASKYQMAMALWYARKVGLPPALVTGRATIQDLFNSDPADATGVQKVYQNGEYVRAMRFLSWAGMCLTRWYPLEGQRSIPGGTTLTLGDGSETTQAHLGLTPPHNAGSTRYNVNVPDFPAHPGLRTGIPIPGVDTDDSSRWIDLSRNVLLPATNWPGANHRFGNQPRTVPNREAPLATDETDAAKIAAWFTTNAPLSLAEVFRQIDLVDGADDGDHGLAAALTVPALPVPAAYAALPADDTLLPPAGRLGLPNQTNRFAAVVPPGGSLHDGQFYVTFEQITTWYELGLRMAMRHASDNPYDWQAVRPVNRQIMTDHPLIQWDLFPSATYPTLTGQITGIANDAHFNPLLSATDRVAEMWRPIAARNLTNIGRSGNNTPLDWASLRGDQAHFNLTAPFAGAERCRELVFWMVDWTSYEDFETAPAARVDASRYPKNSPEGNYLWSASTTSNTTDSLSVLCGIGPGWRLYPYDELQPMWRHPEKSWLFTAPMDGYAALESLFTPAGVDAISPTPRPPPFTQALDTGFPVAPLTCGPDWSSLANNLGGRQYYRYAQQGNLPGPDLGIGRRSTNMRWSTAIPSAADTPNFDNRAVFTGLFGADRNANGILDRGPVSRAVRLRAVEVARLNFYDPRLVLYRR